jgi:two-component system LytT family response regulator
MKMIRIPESDPCLRILVAHKGTDFLLPLCEIVYCQAEGNYTHIFTNGSNRFIAAQNLTKVRRMLTCYGFIAIHKSYLVNGMHITGYSSNISGQIVLTGNILLTVSRRQRAALTRWISLHTLSAEPLTAKNIPLITNRLPQDNKHDQHLL